MVTIECPVCQADLGVFPEATRADHVHRCLDRATGGEAVQDVAERPADEVTGPPDRAVMRLAHCPVCATAFLEKPARARIAHLRQCAKTHNVALGAVIEQLRATAAGPPPPPPPCEPRRPSGTATLQQLLDSDDDLVGAPAAPAQRPPRKRHRAQSAGSDDESVALALALSASLDEPEPSARLPAPGSLFNRVPAAPRNPGSRRGRSEAPQGVAMLASADARTYFFKKAQPLLRDGSLESLLAGEAAPAAAVALETPASRSLWDAAAGRPDPPDASDATLGAVRSVIESSRAAYQRKLDSLQAELVEWSRAHLAARDREIARLLSGRDVADCPEASGTQGLDELDALVAAELGAERLAERPLSGLTLRQLQRRAKRYGLRTNAPREWLEEQLERILRGASDSSFAVDSLGSDSLGSDSLGSESCGSESCGSDSDGSDGVPASGSQGEPTSEPETNPTLSQTQKTPVTHEALASSIRSNPALWTKIATFTPVRLAELETALAENHPDLHRDRRRLAELCEQQGILVTEKT